eukprot:3876503-Amphidinium_carterae.2
MAGHFASCKLRMANLVMALGVHTVMEPQEISTFNRTTQSTMGAAGQKGGCQPKSASQMRVLKSWQMRTGTRAEG